MHIFCRYETIIFNHSIVYEHVVNCQRYPPIYYLVKDFPSNDKTFSGFARVRVPSLALVPCPTGTSNILACKKSQQHQGSYHLPTFFIYLLLMLTYVSDEDPRDNRTEGAGPVGCVVEERDVCRRSQMFNVLGAP